MCVYVCVCVCVCACVCVQISTIHVYKKAIQGNLTKRWFSFNKWTCHFSSTFFQQFFCA